MPSVVIVIVVIMLVSMINSKGKKQKPASKAQPQQVRTSTPEQDTEVKPASTGHFHARPVSDFGQASESEEGGNWICSFETHEGEDPCHQEQHTIEVEETDDTDAEPVSGLSRDIVNGVIWAEIMNRKKR